MEPPTAPKSRAAAVEAKGKPPTAPEPSASAPKPTPAPERPPLCEGQLDDPGRDLPTSALSRSGTPEPPEAIPTGDGKWTWINFWAAWCVPCREEIPRLKSWGEKSDELRVVFVSLDDDARQLESFLAKQPPAGIKSTYWLQDGTERGDWLGSLDIESDPQLPMHLLVDPKGKIRCQISGAVEDGDYGRVTEIVGG